MKKNIAPLASVFAALSLFAVSASAGTPRTPAAGAEDYEVPPVAVRAEPLGASVCAELAPFSRNARDSVPAGDFFRAVAVPAWRGEVVNFRFGVAAGKRPLKKLACPARFFLKNASGATIPATVSPVRWVVGQGGEQFADVVDAPGTPTSVPAGTLRELLVSVAVPADAAPGAYVGEFRPDGKKAFPVRVLVLSATLPPPRERAVHLDLWQHPQAFARWAGVKPWTRAHFEAARAPMERLRDLGQKVVTCSIIEEPWSHQTYDDWESMVKWSRAADGSWRFDYSSFDAWTDFVMNEIGIDAQISCYSMLPWSMKIGYLDKASGTRKTLALDVASPEFAEVWGAFLSDFKKHLAKRGLLEKTCIALDERPDAQLDAARRVVARFAPELKIVSANDHPTRMSDFVYDVSPVFGHSGGDVPALAEKRRAEGRKTTFYVCTQPARPNTFTHSAPAEAHWLGLYAAANGFDGILRWAYNSWNENPFVTTAFGNWPAGDCFLIYPGNRSSMRLERLRDGLEDFEKIAVLRSRAREKGAPAALKKAVAELDDYLKRTFTVAAGGGNAHEEQTLRAVSLLDAASLAAEPTR